MTWEDVPVGIYAGPVDADPTNRGEFKPFIGGEFNVTTRLIDVGPDLDVYRMIYGEEPKPKHGGQEVSLAVEYETSGEPIRPDRKRGWWAWFTRVNQRAHRRWQKRRDQWIADGSPPGRAAMFYPRATVARNDEEDT